MDMRDEAIKLLKYTGAFLFWMNVTICFIMWNIDNSVFRGLIVFAIMFMTGKYLEEEDK